MKRKHIWFLLACSAGAVFSLYFVAAYAVRHPESWTGRVSLSLCRVIYPSERLFTPLQTDNAAAPLAAPENVVVAARTPPVPNGPRLVPALEVVEVLEPIAIESPFTIRTGSEESEFPIVFDLPPQRPVTQPQPRRMPFADEMPDVSASTDAPQFSTMVWNAALQFAFHVRTTHTDTTGTAVSLGAFDAIRRLIESGEEEASVEEEADVEEECPEDNARPVGNHHHYHHHCPHSGGRCLPSHYRNYEIPTATPRMPGATDTPLTPPIELGEEESTPSVPNDDMDD